MKANLFSVFCCAILVPAVGAPTSQRLRRPVPLTDINRDVVPVTVGPARALAVRIGSTTFLVRSEVLTNTLA